MMSLISDEIEVINEFFHNRNVLIEKRIEFHPDRIKDILSDMLNYRLELMEYYYMEELERQAEEELREQERFLMMLMEQ